MKTTIDESDVIDSAAKRISELARSSDLSTPIDHLGRWKVRDVVAHLGGIHRWATRIITTRSMDGPGFTKSKLDGTDLCEWFDVGADELLEALRANGSDEECPNFNPGSPNTVAWWSRRQMHETTVHRWDVECGLGCITPIAPNVAADGVDEYLDVFIRTRGKQTLTGPLVLATTEPSRVWTLTPAAMPGRIDIAPGRSATAAAELSGHPEKLLLALWRRLTYAEAGLTVDGDQQVAASLIEQP